MSRTVGYTLGVEVGLHVASVDTDPLKVNLVLDVGHENEGSDDALALGRGELGANLAVPDIVRGCEQCADGALGHGQEGRLLAVAGVRVDGGGALRLPVDLGGVAEVLVDGLHIVEGVERVGSGLADGTWDARVEGVRHERVATAEAEGAYTAVAIYCAWLAGRAKRCCWNVRTRAAGRVLGAVVVLGALCGEGRARQYCSGEDGGNGGPDHVGGGFRSVGMSCKGAKCRVQLSKAPRPREWW